MLPRVLLTDRFFKAGSGERPRNADRVGTKASWAGSTEAVVKTRGNLVELPKQRHVMPRPGNANFSRLERPVPGREKVQFARITGTLRAAVDATRHRAR